MKLTKKFIDDLSYRVIGCAIEVHKRLKAGLLESVYEKCFVHELGLNGLKWEAQRNVPLNYKGIYLDAELRYDVLIEDILVVEIKAIEAILPVDESQVLTYMRLLERPKGIILNFNCVNIFKQGQKTLVNEIYSELPKE
jgi:GxxExxY protein